MKNRAFTLLELLVVITIIGILSSIVIVSMSGSTDSAIIAKSKAYAQQVHALLGANAVGVWNFDEGAGTTLTDISGYGNNGTLNKGANGTGLDWVASDIEGTALQFDGVDDYIDAGNRVSLDITDAITIESWIYPISKVAAWSDTGIVMMGDINGVPYGYTLDIRTAAGKLWFYINHPNNLQISLSRNVWTHVVATYSKTEGKMRVYKNGVSAAFKDYSLNIGGITERSLMIGKQGSQYFFGLIDEARIYTEALPSTEIQKHYVQGLERLLTNQVITKAEYDQRIEEFNQSLVLYEE